LRSRLISPADYEKADVKEAAVHQHQSQFLHDDGTAALIREQASLIKDQAFHIKLSKSPLNAKRSFSPLKPTVKNTSAFMTQVKSP
jgi:hypothetical protein